MSTIADPLIPPADGTCHFTRLSGEIRNLIYAYTFHTPLGLHFPFPPNALQLVNHLLHRETARLELHHNALHFPSTYRHNSTDRALSFLNFHKRHHATGTYLALSVIHIYCRFCVFLAGSLKQLSRAHPHITVCVHTNYISPFGDKPLYKIILLEYAAHRTINVAKRCYDELPLWIAERDEIVKANPSLLWPRFFWVGKTDLADVLDRYRYRFFPLGDQLDEGTFDRERMRGNLWWEDRGASEREMEARLAVLEEYWRNGI